jgi:hypothetical protein
MYNACQYSTSVKEKHLDHEREIHTAHSLIAQVYAFKLSKGYLLSLRQLLAPPQSICF